uniref:Secreted protein n=1 Tax=Setaria viridis TaxID=4556 RepID=A0A4U6SZW6_SETVI|nr:hypothetical protein SEVIR_9G199550v2 [Setaria viridis]
MSLSLLSCLSIFPASRSAPALPPAHASHRVVLPVVRCTPPLSSCSSSIPTCIRNSSGGGGPHPAE